MSPTVALIALAASLLILSAIGVVAYALWLLRQVLEELRGMSERLADALELARRVGAIEERLRHSEERQGQIIHDLNMGLHKVRSEVSALSDEVVSIGIRDAAG